MKIKIQLHDPDALYVSVKDAISKERRAEPDFLTDQQAASMTDMRIDNVKEIASKWFEYDEYVTLEIDTEAGTCIVLEAEES